MRRPWFVLTIELNSTIDAKNEVTVDSVLWTFLNKLYLCNANAQWLLNIETDNETEVTVDSTMFLLMCGEVTFTCPLRIQRPKSKN